MKEPKVIRRNSRFSGFIPDPNWPLRFEEYIKPDRKDCWAAVGIGIIVLVVVALDSGWFVGWFK